MNYIKIGKDIVKYDDFNIDAEYMDFPWKLDAFSCTECEDALFYYKIGDFLDAAQVESLLGESLSKEYSGFYYFEINKCENGLIYTLRINRDDIIILAYRISQDFKLWQVIYDNTKTNGKYAFEHFNRMYSYIILNFGSIVFHSSLIEYNNKGILICAPSGTGKTTHARLWRDKENALIINGDRPLCSKDSGIWYGYGTPWCGTSGEMINRKVPIKAIVILQQHKKNILTKLDVMASIARVISNVIVPLWDETLMNKAMDCIQDIIEHIPVYNLKCLPNYEAVDVLKNEIDKL